MIKVKNTIPVYEMNGRETDWNEYTIEVESHWNDPSKVVLVVDGKTCTVVAKDMYAAIENAQNSKRF